MTINSFALDGTPTPIFTSIGVSVISAAYFCNVDQMSSQMFSVWLVQNGDNATDTNMIYSNVAVVASDTYVMDREKIVLDNGDSIYANCSASISATISSFSQ